MATETPAPAPVVAETLPSGSSVSVTTDGFEISSNTGTAEDIREELGIPADNAPAQPPADAPPTRARRNDREMRHRSIQSQIDADTARRETAKKDADAEEARLTKLRSEAQTVRQPAAPPPQRPQPPAYDGSDASDPEPSLQQFAHLDDPYTARLEARQDWAARKEVRKFQQQQQRQIQQGQAEQNYTKRTSSLTEKIKAHEAKDPDFKQKIDPDIAAALVWSTPVSVGTPLGDLVMDSPNPVELMIHFSQHKDDFARISQLHPLLQAAELGEVRGYLKSKAQADAARPRPVSRASAPIKALGGNPAHAPEDTRSDEELSDTEHDAKYAKLRRQYR